MALLSSAVRSVRALLNTTADPAAPAIQGLREEIDGIDLQILALIEQRLDVARRIGRAKAPASLNLKPDREAAVISRLVQRARRDDRDLALAVWRELMAAGLRVQGEVEIVLWAGRSGRIGLDAARRRFGCAALYEVVATPMEALRRADDGGAVALLALDSEEPWWIKLATDYPELWVFDALDGARGPGEPRALALGRVDPAALAPGRSFVVSGGGDAGLAGRPRQTLGLSAGWSLSIGDQGGDAPLEACDRARGLVGRSPRFCLSAHDIETAAPHDRPVGHGHGGG